ncbi:nuclear transport factor 2 family protein [Streptomyces sporangiiformans]|uniref:Nuclear transport factor 2 family protein n=1 Tax=Streptomyces sporangiiformans TaxID=2315329 RepID=A0A505DM13_9ACTN|nr:nuclear transport factor 2 family protein [Streptomyces sporangiiformans]
MTSLTDPTAADNSRSSEADKSHQSVELRKTVERYWAAAEARDWAAFADTLAEDVVYTLSQTRERIRGREKYVQFNREYPGDWRLRIERIVAEPGHVVTWVHFTVGLEEMYGISFFTEDGEGRILSVTDFWPEPYEPPAGREHLVERY